jgi:hypothetical protein
MTAIALHDSQRAALEHITRYARGRREQAKVNIAHILQMTDVPAESFEAAVSHLKACARVALHFHPDRPDTQMRPVAAGLLESGIYKSQFETLLSSGSVSAFPGGERDHWEERLFGGAYQREGTTDGHRPKYGALDLMRHSDGPAPRFGSCYFLLHPEVSERCTYTYLDSHQDPREKGSYEEFDDLLAALLTEIFFRDLALGEKDLTVARFVRHLQRELACLLVDSVERRPARNLNHYIEAQVHGEVRLGRDVEALVADPSFRGSEIGGLLVRMSERYGFTLHFHRGFVLSAVDTPCDFRGATMPSLAKRIAREGYVDARCIGEAAMALKRDPAVWADRGSYAEVLQELKLLWHVLVRYGQTT